MVFFFLFCFILLLEEIQFLSLCLPFLTMFKSSRVRFRLFVAGNIHIIAWFPIFVSWLLLFCWLLCCQCCFWSLKLVFLCSFFCNLRDVLSMYQRNLQSWRVLFLLLFLTYIVCLYHLRDVRSYVSSWVFLSSGLFVEVLLLSALRMVPSILGRDQPRRLSLCWDFCYIVWFWVIFSFSWGSVFFIFSFISACLMVPAFNIPKYF